MDNEKPDVNNIKHGLMVIDPDEKGEMFEVLHFVGYWNEPTPESVKHLREELKTDKEFGLTDIADRLSILPAPDYIVERYVNMIKNEIEDD